ncbi:hypothetical protein HK102_012558, partial [Quaeritorhiza haematococci]
KKDKKEALAIAEDDAAAPTPAHAKDDATDENDEITDASSTFLITRKGVEARCERRT